MIFNYDLQNAIVAFVDSLRPTADRSGRST